MIFISVDLPAPFSPTSPWISAAASAKSTDRRAVTPPKPFVIPASSSNADIVASNQEVRLHPHHPGCVGFGHHGSVNDDVLGDAARARLFAADHSRDTGNDGATVNTAGRIADRCQHPSVADRCKRRRHGIAAGDLY